MATLTETLVIQPPSPANSETPLFSNTPVTDSHDAQDNDVENEPSTMFRKVTVTLQLAGINFTNSAVNGLIIVGLPRITADLNLPDSLAFWPSSVASLATASTLLLAGSVADVIGPRSVDLVGSLLSGAFMVGCGFTQRGEQLVVMRALQGVGVAMHLASSVSLVTKLLPRGKGRNVAFSCLGLSQPLGFSFGLVLGGVFVDTIGWRSAWYIYGAITLALSASGIFTLPRETSTKTWGETFSEARTRVDWVGALLASAFMAQLSYFLAVISTNIYRIREATSIMLLCLGTLALPLFLTWVHRQVKLGRPALIPNSFWRNSSFSSICGTIALSFAVLNAQELFSSLFFQEVQQLSALQAALRILPSLVVGTILNFTTGLFVHKIPAMWIVVTTGLLTAISPVLMAVIQPSYPYWTNAFFAQILMPVACDVLFTVGLIIITDIFPEDKQAVAGAVYNTAAQFGCSFGLAVMQVVSTLVTKENENRMKPVKALMEGYRASFWTMFAFSLTCVIIGGVGLRKKGKIGLKSE